MRSSTTVMASTNERNGATWSRWVQQQNGRIPRLWTTFAIVRQSCQCRHKSIYLYSRWCVYLCPLLFIGTHILISVLSFVVIFRCASMMVIKIPWSQYFKSLFNVTHTDTVPTWSSTFSDLGTYTTESKINVTQLRIGMKIKWPSGFFQIEKNSRFCQGENPSGF